MRHTLVALALACSTVVSAAGCGSEAPGIYCEDECLEGQWCDEETGLCVSAGNVDVSMANFSPVFDAKMVDGRFKLAAYDRLGGRFLYGEEAASGKVSWQAVAVGGASPGFQPRVALLAAQSGSLLYMFESGPGEVELARPAAGGWMVEDMFDAEGPLTEVHGFFSAQTGLQVCAGDVDSRLLYGESDGTLPLTVSAVELPDGMGTASVPCRTMVYGGRPTVLAAGLPVGLLSIHKAAAGGFEATWICNHATVGAMSFAATESGGTVAFLDLASGALEYAASESGKLKVYTADPEAAAGGPLGAIRPRISLAADPNSSQVYVVYHDVLESVLKVRYIAGPGSLGMVADVPMNDIFLPVLGFDASGTARIAGARFPCPSGPGTIEIVEP